MEKKTIFFDLISKTKERFLTAIFELITNSFVLIKCRPSLRKNIKIVNLLSLQIRNQKMTESSKTENSIPRMKKIFLDNNSLQKIPKKLFDLKYLEYISLQDNEISEIPEEIMIFTNLQVLNLKNNNIRKLPFSIGNLLNLKTLILDGNPLENSFKNIYYKKDLAGFLSYCREMDVFYKPPLLRRWVKIEDVLNENTIIFSGFSFNNHEFPENRFPILNGQYDSFDPLFDGYFNSNFAYFQTNYKPLKSIKDSYRKKMNNLMHSQMNILYKNNDNSYFLNPKDYKISILEIIIPMRQQLKVKFEESVISLFLGCESVFVKFFHQLTKKIIDFYSYEVENLHSVKNQIFDLFFMQFLCSMNQIKRERLEENLELSTMKCVLCSCLFSCNQKIRLDGLFSGSKFLSIFMPDQILENIQGRFSIPENLKDLKLLPPHSEKFDTTHIKKALQRYLIKKGDLQSKFNNFTMIKGGNNYFQVRYVQICRGCIENIRYFYFSSLISQSYYRTKIVQALKFMNEYCISLNIKGNEKKDQGMECNNKKLYKEYYFPQYSFDEYELEKYDTFINKVDPRLNNITDFSKKFENSIFHRSKEIKNCIDLKFVIRYAFLK